MTAENEKSLGDFDVLFSWNNDRDIVISSRLKTPTPRIKGRATLNHGGESQVHGGRDCIERERERKLKLKGLDRIVSQVTHEIKLVVCGLG